MQTKNIPKRVNFFDWIGSLSYEERKRVRDRIIRETGIGYPTWYGWLRRRSMSAVYERYIRLLFPEYDFIFEPEKR